MYIPKNKTRNQNDKQQLAKPTDESIWNSDETPSEMDHERHQKITNAICRISNTSRDL